MFVISGIKKSGPLNNISDLRVSHPLIVKLSFIVYFNSLAIYVYVLRRYILREVCPFPYDGKAGTAG